MVATVRYFEDSASAETIPRGMLLNTLRRINIFRIVCILEVSAKPRESLHSYLRNVGTQDRLLMPSSASHISHRSFASYAESASMELLPGIGKKWRRERIFVWPESTMRACYYRALAVRSMTPNRKIFSANHFNKSASTSEGGLPR